MSWQCQVKYQLRAASPSSQEDVGDCICSGSVIFPSGTSHREKKKKKEINLFLYDNPIPWGSTPLTKGV